MSPAKLENVYGQIPKVAQIFVYGDSLKHFLVAVVVPDPLHVKAFAEQRGIPKAEAFSGPDFKAAPIPQMEAKVK